MKIKNRFEIDCLQGKKFIGTQDPMVKWNGFDCPTFTGSEARHICAQMMNAGVLEETQWRGLDGYISTTIEGNTDHWKIIDGECALGAYAWCWGSDLSWTAMELIKFEDILSTGFATVLLKLRKEAGVRHVKDDGSAFNTFFYSPEWQLGDPNGRLEVVFGYIQYMQALSAQRKNTTGQYFETREFTGMDHKANAQLFVAGLKKHHGFDAEATHHDDLSAVNMEGWPEGECFTDWFDDFTWAQGIRVHD